MGSIDFAKEHWFPTVDLPDEYEVRDFTTGDDSPSKYEFDIGRYDEVRPGMYNTELFTESRCIHVGIDIGGPIGTPVKSIANGVVAFSGYNPADGDYGHTVIIHHLIQGQNLWVLYGHLDAASTENCTPGKEVSGGEIIAWFGAEDENGGWPSHLHFQLSYREPTTYDLPGVVTPSEREQALLDFPDPRLVLGPLY
jgi:murein DD-endopeptidase MepM/ murein hydrolase activator NlpD